MDAIDRINIRLKKLLEYIDQLKTYIPTTKKELIEDADKRGAAERYLQLACEVVIDIANILNAEFRFRPADDAKESVKILGEVGVLDKAFANEFADMAGFRNILVHDYLVIDYEKVADILNNRLGDFERFAREVSRYLS